MGSRHSTNSGVGATVLGGGGNVSSVHHQNDRKQPRDEIDNAIVTAMQEESRRLVKELNSANTDEINIVFSAAEGTALDDFVTKFCAQTGAQLSTIGEEYTTMSRELRVLQQRFRTDVLEGGNVGIQLYIANIAELILRSLESMKRRQKEQESAKRPLIRVLKGSVIDELYVNLPSLLSGFNVPPATIQLLEILARVAWASMMNQLDSASTLFVYIRQCDNSWAKIVETSRSTVGVSNLAMRFTQNSRRRLDNLFFQDIENTWRLRNYSMVLEIDHENAGNDLVATNGTMRLCEFICQLITRNRWAITDVRQRMAFLQDPEFGDHRRVHLSLCSNRATKTESNREDRAATSVLVRLLETSGSDIAPTTSTNERRGSRISAARSTSDRSMRQRETVAAVESLADVFSAVKRTNERKPTGYPPARSILVNQ